MVNQTSFKWTCPYCSSPQTVTENNSSIDEVNVSVRSTKHGRIRVKTASIGCSNRDCDELAIRVFATSLLLDGLGNWFDTQIEVFELGGRPSSSSQPQPDYIPLPIRQDYYEACSIQKLSPKASATLSRRCLQGMIRDFCMISRPRLFDEIRDLKAALEGQNPPRGVQHDTVDAIDAVRRIGNIGAHMEADINKIVEVDEGEAKTLIDLIELLFAEWYVSRHNRQQRVSSVIAVADEMAQQKALPQANT